MDFVWFDAALLGGGSYTEPGWPRLPARLASRGPAIGFHAIHRYRNWVSNVEGAYSKVPLVRHTDFLLETELCSPLQTQPAVGI